MTFSSMGSKSLSDIQAKLNTAKDINDKDHLDLIKDTSDALFNLFKESSKDPKYAEINTAKGIDHKKDLEKLKTVLAEKETLLEDSAAIKDKSIEDTYTVFATTGGTPVTAPEKAKLGKKFEDIYNGDVLNLSKYFGKLPADITNFRKGIREDFFKDIESAGYVNKTRLDNAAKKLKDKDVIKGTMSPELRIKLTKLLLLAVQVDQCIEKGTDEAHYVAANILIDKIQTTFKQLEALEHLKKNKAKINKRLSNIDALDQNNPKELVAETLDKAAPKTITISLKDLFIDPTKSLQELPDEYILNTISIKDKDGKDIPLFADATGAALSISMAKGTTQELFVKDGSTYVSIGNVELGIGEIKVTTSKYADLPNDLVAPFKYTFNVQGIGGNKSGTKTANHVAITKDLTQAMEKPTFDAEYDELEDEYKINGKLSMIFDEQYESQLKERFYDVLSKDPQCMAEWAKLTADEKNDFFQKVMNGGTPTWADGRPVPAELTRAACYTKDEYHADIKKWILKGFTGKTKVELKKYIFDKLGTLDFTELGKNPYAIKVLADSIRDKMRSKSDDAFYLLNHYALATRFEKTEPVDKEELPDGSLAGEKVLDAAVADSKEIYKESAYDRAQKQLEEYYKSGARFGLKRARVFFFRGQMIDKAIAKDLKANKGMHMNSTSNAAVNRWMLEQAMGGDFAQNIEENTTIFDDPVFQDRLNTLVENYFKNPDASADGSFASEVQSLIMSNTQLKLYMKEHKITHLGTNLVEQAKAEKEERNYYTGLINIINQYTTDGSLNKPQEFDVAIRKQLAEFAKQQNRLPDMIKHLDLQVDDIRFAEKIAKHKITLERMKMRTVKLRLRLLTNKSEDEKGLTTAQDVDRDKFAKPGKLTKWMEKHPWWTTSLTAVGLVGAGVIGTLTAPVLGAGAGATLLWYLNFLKKRGHYTEEHKKFEQQILAMTPEQREKYLEEMKEKSEKLPKFLRFFASDQYTKYGKSMEYLTQTDSVQKIIGDLDRYINKPTMLQSSEKDQFATYLKDAITLLEMHKREGRNFMHGEQGKAQVEELYNLLHQKVIAGIRRYDGNKNPDHVIGVIAGSIDQHQNISDLQDEYTKEKKDMSKMKNKLGIFAGSKSAAIYLGTAWLGGIIKNQVADGWNHLFGQSHTTTPVAPTPGHTVIGHNVDLDTAFGQNPNGKDLLQHVFNNDTAKYHQLVDKIQHLQTGDHQTTLRGSLKEIFGTDQLANAKTHEIFNQFAGKITDHGVQELVQQGANVNLHSATQIGNLMAHRGYTGSVTDPSHIQSLISGLKDGTFDINHLPTGWTKETACNVLFCNTQGHQLTDLFFDTFVKQTTTPGIPGGVVTPPVTPIPGVDARSNFLPFGLPTFFNEIRNKK